MRLECAWSTGNIKMNATNAQQFQFKYTVKLASLFSFLEGQTEGDATVFSI